MALRKKSNETTKKVIVLFIAFLMVGSVFGIILYGFAAGNPNAQEFNGYKFYYRGDHWETEVDDVKVAFLYLPPDITYIKLPDDVRSRLKGASQIDMTSDFNDTHAQGIALAQFQFDMSLRDFKKFTRSGFTSVNQFNAPVLTCQQATQFVPMIYFKKANTTAVYTQGNCIIADALNPVDVIRIKDRLLYDMLGIIP